MSNQPYSVREINWDYPGDSIPAFLTLLIIPLSYNIAYGVIAGIITYIVINGSVWAARKLSGDRIIPPTYEYAEAWVIPPGGLMPAWITYFMNRGNGSAATEVPLEARHSTDTAIQDQRKESGGYTIQMEK